MNQQTFPAIATKKRPPTLAECKASWTPAAREEARRMIKQLAKWDPRRLQYPTMTTDKEERR